MKRIMYLSLLLVIPFLVNANHGIDRLNGNWISPFHGKTIKLKVKRNKIQVKNISHRGWTNFYPSYRGSFEDSFGNTIQLKNAHEFIYKSNRRHRHSAGERIRFVKKGHIHHNHVCSTRCEVGYDLFNYRDDPEHHYENRYDDSYNNNYGDRGNRNDRFYDSKYNNGYGDSWSNSTNGNNARKVGGRYFVREVDEFILIEDTRTGLRAKRGDKHWVNYTQNKNRKNEYIDHKGNRYLIKSDGSLVWKNKRGDVSLNLSR